MERTDQRREPDALAKLGARIGEWRQRRAKPGPMPETLWRAAAKLAEKHGLNRVAAPLRLDYYSLKRWVEEGHDQRRSAARGPAFIEVCPQAWATSVLELEKPGGSKMTLRLSSTLDVGALVEAFWRSRT
jgi:hypothetical protein